MSTIETTTNWIDAHELTIEGQAWPAESDAYCRLPNRAKGAVTDGVWEHSRHSAGVCVRFATDSPSIAVRWQLRNKPFAMWHMPAAGMSGVDLYVEHEGRMRWLAVGGKSDEPVMVSQPTLVKDLSREDRRYTLYLPLYNGVESLQIGLPESVRVRPWPRDLSGPAARPICFYGTSVTQGGCASRAGMAYTSIMCRRLNRPHWNLGFSGNGKSEPEVADLLAELDPSVFVLDQAGNMDAPMIQERVEPLVMKIRKAQPMTPIVMVEMVRWQNAYLVETNHREVESINAAFADVYARLSTAKVPGIQFVRADAFYGDDGEATVDGIHATDVGFLRIAAALEPVLRPLVK